MKNLLCILLAFSCINFDSIAEDTQSNYFAFIDSYYLADFDRKISFDRPYTTQAGRDNQLRINLGAFGGEYKDDLFKAKLTVQDGDSVRLNYSAEPDYWVRYLQEGFVGVALSPESSIDAGIMLSHIGAEGWMSKDNLLYTRSLIAEYSPYYQLGARVNHTFNNVWSGQLLILNGWQNISDERHPALGTQLVWKGSDATTLVHNSFIGNEVMGTRMLNDFILSEIINEKLTLTTGFDIGFQERDGVSDATWWGCSVMAKQKLNDTVSFGVRGELFSDPHQIVATTTTGDDFLIRSISFGIDLDLGKGFSLRNEVKHSWSGRGVFPDGGDTNDDDTFFVTSLSFLL